MGKYVIKGGKKLSGSVKINSAKNAILPMIAATILTEEEVIINDCPPLLDVLSMIDILGKLGVDTKLENGNLIVNSKGFNCEALTEDFTKKLRTSILMIGALLGRCGKAKLTYPGGCEIGERPIDIHLEAFKGLGVEIIDNKKEIVCAVDKLKGGEITLSYPSVGATENLLLASVIGEKVTRIKNYAKEPEIIDLINMLNAMGARIGVCDKYIEIIGVKRLHGTEYKPIPDRIEAGTFLLSALVTGGEVEIKGVNAKNILPLINKFKNNTCNISIFSDIIYVKSGKERKPFNLTTGPYPMFPTDLQAQTAVLSSISNGVSTIRERVFENRFGYTKELIKMGARLSVRGDTATIIGVESLQGAKVTAKDLRGGEALVLAGLSADGVSEVDGTLHIDRGYFEFDKKLRQLGADIEKFD